jgi:hypothetical protein
LLLDDTSQNDRIVALRALGFDLMVIVLRKAIWIGRPTNDPFAPVSFEPRIYGVGAVTEPTVRTVLGGVMFLSDAGVKLFDGSTVTHMSSEIDQDILPLAFDSIHDYSAVYNPQDQVYSLFTPNGTFDYEFIYQRWMPRSLVVDRAVAIHNPLSFNFEEGTGGWGMNWGSFWGDAPPAGPGASSDAMIYQKGSDLGSPDPSITTYFGVEQTPVWSSPESEVQQMDDVVSVNRIDLHYTGVGEVAIETPDEEGDYEAYGSAVLDSDSADRVAKVYAIRSGLGAGVRLRISSGFPQIARIGVEFERLSGRMG